MMAQVQVQACGCIALPDDVSRATGIGPGSVLHIELHDEKTLQIVRVSEPVAPDLLAKPTACPVP